MHNAFIISSAVETVQDCLVDYARSARASSFALAATEIEFGPGKDNTCAIELDDGTMLNLTGKIDRVDIANIDGDNVALLYDYKRQVRSGAIDYKKISSGLDIQLPVYMIAVSGMVVNGKTIDHLAGAFLLPVEFSPESDSPKVVDAVEQKYKRKGRGFLNGAYCDDIDRTVDSGWSDYYTFYIGRKDGPYAYFNNSSALKPDQFDRLLAYVRDQIVKLAGGIVDGCVEIHPARIGTFEPCKWCDYVSLCRFDSQVNEYNVLPAVTKQQLIERLEGDDE